MSAILHCVAGHRSSGPRCRVESCAVRLSGRPVLFDTVRYITLFLRLSRVSKPVSCLPSPISPPVYLTPSERSPRCICTPGSFFFFPAVSKLERRPEAPPPASSHAAYRPLSVFCVFIICKTSVVLLAPFVGSAQSSAVPGASAGLN